MPFNWWIHDLYSQSLLDHPSTLPFPENVAPQWLPITLAVGCVSPLPASPDFLFSALCLNLLWFLSCSALLRLPCAGPLILLPPLAHISSSKAVAFPSLSQSVLAQLSAQHASLPVGVEWCPIWGSRCIFLPIPRVVFLWFIILIRSRQHDHGIVIRNMIDTTDNWSIS